jgi:GDP-L-fucose synthase
MADACVFLMNLPDPEFSRLFDEPENPPLINIGYGEDITIRELAETVAQVLGFRGELIFDSSKPDGTSRKLMDSSRLRSLGWRPKINLEQGIRAAYRDFRNRASSVIA